MKKFDNNVQFKTRKIKHLWNMKKIKKINKIKTLDDYGIKNPCKKIYETIEGEKMKIPVEESKKVAEGKHDGEIVDIKYRTEPYEYTDIIVKVEDDIELSVGYPTKITADSALGELLTRFGAKLKIGEKVEVEEFLTKGLKVTMMCVEQVSKKDGKSYVNVMRESLKPIK